MIKAIVIILKESNFCDSHIKDILPECIVNQKEKTNYSAIIGTTLRNDHKPLSALFNSNNFLITSELGIIKKQEFCNKIKNVLTYAEDLHYFSNEETNYYMNVIKLEIWLQMVSKGR
ncbi:MAG: hypothetical protein FWC41_03915 [Firmicutes bacterium]|nr:hypothetical protein [Bacillota bacterium]